MTRKFAPYSTSLLFGACALITVSAPAFAGDSAKEASTAATHASLASKSTSIEQVHMHLHHAVNCLVGPEGKGFDEFAMNPCKGMGAGAIPDSTDPDLKVKLEDALKAAIEGLDSDDLKNAQDQAAATAQKLM